MSGARLVFIGGCERSGTTLLHSLLCAHSRVVGGPELMFGGRIAELHRHMAWTLTRGAGPYSSRLRSLVDRAELDEAFRQLYRSLLARRQKQCPDARFVSEQTPSNILSARALLSLFPDSRFVHLVRDGRAVVASHRAVRSRLRSAGGASSPELRSLRLRRVCARWNAAMEAHWRLQTEPELASRCCSVRFEDLVADPGAILAQLMGFLELESEPAVESPIRVRHEGPIPDAWTSSAMHGDRVDGSRATAWRGELGFGRGLLCALLIGAQLDRLGYPVSPVLVAANRLLRRR